MASTSNKTTIALAATAALTAGIALTPMTASADANPFATTELSSGYMQLAEGKCGEAKCGADKKAEHEAKCGEKMGEKMKEGKCGEAKCGADKKAAEKMEEGKCGEAKCGANK
jgi:uncharacterized low-complexity protein